jgi:hypothetical protein
MTRIVLAVLSSRIWSIRGASFRVGPRCKSADTTVPFGFNEDSRTKGERRSAMCCGILVVYDGTGDDAGGDRNNARACRAAHGDKGG